MTRGDELLRKDIIAIASVLREAVPLSKPASLRFCASRGSPYFGTCEEIGGAYVLHIYLRVREGLKNPLGRKVTYAEARDTLLHEWAHALVMGRAPKDRVGHTAQWGAAYARCYRALEVPV